MPGFRWQDIDAAASPDSRRDRRRRAAVAASPRPSANASHLVQGRARAGEALHDRRHRPSRLWRQRQARGRRRTSQLLEARDGGRSGGRHDGAGLRSLRRRRARSRRARRASHGARPSRSDHAVGAARHRADGHDVCPDKPRICHALFLVVFPDPAVRPARAPDIRRSRFLSRPAYLASQTKIADSLDPRVLAEYRRCYRDPATRHAICEDYRAAASIDLEHDAADSDRRIEAPLLVLWGGLGTVGALFDVLETWRAKARMSRATRSNAAIARRKKRRMPCSWRWTISCRAMRTDSQDHIASG
jgi:hypothetical protein